jgi:hypothetical protein
MARASNQPVCRQGTPRPAVFAISKIVAPLGIPAATNAAHLAIQATTRPPPKLV